MKVLLLVASILLILNWNTNAQIYVSSPNSGQQIIKGNNITLYYTSPKNPLNYTVAQVYKGTQLVYTYTGTTQGVNNYIPTGSLAAGSDYKIKVIENGTTTYGWSGVFSIVVLPDAPVATTASNVSTSAFQANWNAVSTASSYVLEVSTSTGFSTLLSASNVSQNQSTPNTTTSTSMWIYNTSPGTTYYYRVKAVNAVGSSGYSSVVTVNSPLPDPILSEETNVTDNSFTANWGTVSGATSYRLDVATDASFINILPSYNNLTVSGSSHNVNGLSPYTAYYYRVRAVNGGSSSANSDYIFALTLPPPPTATLATNVTANSFTANWTAPAAAEAQYTIELSTDINFTSPTTFSAGSSYSYGFAGLTANQSYYYRVRVTRGSLTSNNSTTITTVTLLSSPVVSAATNLTSTSFTANWQSVTGASQYQFELSNDNFQTVLSSYTSNVSGTSKAISGLPANGVYYYRVKAKSASNASAYSNAMKVAHLSVLKPVSGEIVTVGTNLTFRYSSPVAISYAVMDLYKGTTKITGLSNVVANTDYVINTTGYQLGNDYWVNVYETSSASVYGKGSNFTIGPMPSPNAGDPTSVTTNSFIANWEVVPGATGYRIDVSDNLNFTPFLAGYEDVSVSGGTSYAVYNGISPGTSYYYRVRALNSSSTSANSNVIPVLTLPAQPVMNPGSNRTNTSATLTWSSVKSAVYYLLDIATSPDFLSNSFHSNFENFRVDGLTQSISGLTSGTTYYCRVRAVNASGISPYSNTVRLLGAPQALPATSVTESSFLANWSTVEGADAYYVTVSTNQSFEPASLVNGYGNLQVSGSSVSVSGLRPGNNYYYKVVAGYAADFSPTLNVIATITLPPAPTTLAASEPGLNRFTANWTSSTGATGYKLDVSTNPYFSSYVPGYAGLDVDGLSKVVSGIDHKVTYYYRVRAINASGASAFSNTIEVNIDRTYLLTVTPTVAVSTSAELTTLSTDDKEVKYEFVDGLGRPEQTVLVQHSPSHHDLVQPFSYDEFGREGTKYLPFISGNDGWFKTDFVSVDKEGYASISNPQYAFYQNTDKIAVSSQPYSQVVFEPSPLNRIDKQGAYGSQWQPNGSSYEAANDRAISFDYQSNVAGEVLLWTNTDLPGDELGLVSAAVGDSIQYYEANSLFKNKRKDEDHNEVIEYSDKEGKTILKSVQVSDSTYAHTYYVYDDLSNLVCVLPPESVRQILAANSNYFLQSESGKKDFLERWAFRYKYDSRNRMIIKQVPGSAPIFMIYDQRDRLVLTQDGNQRATNPSSWAFTKYDELNRPILTGLKDTASLSPITREAMQAAVNAHYERPGAEWGEKYDPLSRLHGYTNKTYPVTTTDNAVDANHYLTVTYYDNYQFRDQWLDSYTYSDEGLSDTINTVIYRQPLAESIGVRGQVTGSKVKVLDGGARGGYNWLKTANYYDEKYRLIQSIADNYKGGQDRTTNLYDFVGKILQTKIEHSTNEISWQGLENAVAVGNNINKVLVSNGWSTGGMTAQQLPSGVDGWIECIISDPNQITAFGLSESQEDHRHLTMDYCFYLNLGVGQIYEDSDWKDDFPRTLKSGDVVRIERVGTNMNYYLNGALVHTTNGASSAALRGDVSISTRLGNIVVPRASFAARADSVVRRFAYDHAGRLKEVWHQINQAPDVRITYNEYNELGQLVDKKIHSTATLAANAIQSIDYRYNIRGWLTRMNEEDLSGGDPQDPTDYFSFKLAYDSVEAGLSNASMFNGNISAMKWSTNLGMADEKMKAYTYSYDQMNRITGATFKTATGMSNALSWSTPPTGAFSESGYSYDLNGNILGLIRKDKNAGNLDSLRYDYGTGALQSNRLLNVTDGGSKTEGFTEFIAEGNDYEYDENGNLVWDKNKGGEEVLDNGGFSQGSSGWAVTDAGGRLTFQNDSVSVVSHATASATLRQDDIILSHAMYVVIVDVDRQAGQFSISLGSGGNKWINTSGKTVFTYESKSGNDFIVTIPPTFVGHIKSIAVKGIVVISYNHLNLPEKVVKGLQQSMRYIYDANGRKISQEVYDEQGIIVKKSDYEGDFFYQNDTLQFVNHAEGRAIISTGTPEYQYNLKDHLGNVRLTFTTKPDEEQAVATMETVHEADELVQFLHYDEAIKINYDLFDHTYDGTTGQTYYSTRLTGGNTNAKYGLAKSLSVMPGDTIKMKVFAKYLDPDPNNWSTALQNFMAHVSGGTAPDGTIVDAGGAGSIGALSFPYTGFLNHSNETGTAPKAYLNYIVFDRDFNPIIEESGFIRITTASKEDGDNVPHDLLEKTSLVIRQAGYVYIYLSNENETPVEVFFDDFEVKQVKSPIVQMDDYYPFGLTFNSFVRENSVAQHYKFNGKEEQTELALGWFDYGARMLDPSLGRWFVVDNLADHPKQISWTPYHYVKNNPVNSTDPDGNCGDCFLDLAFILYDVGEIVYDYVTTGEVNPVSVAALSADAVALATPVVTGAGAVVRVGKKGGEVVAKQLAKQGAEKAATETGEKTAREAGEKASKEEVRFVADTDGKIIDTKSTPKGSYHQPDGSRTDILQDKPHYNKKEKKDHGTSHTHAPYSNTNPATGEVRTGADRNNTHLPTYEEIMNIINGTATKQK